MQTRVLAVLVSTLLAAPTFAKELSGVTMPDTVDVGGKTLKLNGMGLRKKSFVKVYVAGLYLEETSSDPAAILAKDQIRRIDMVMLRDVDKEATVNALKEGFEKNSADKMPALKERLDKYMAMMPGGKKGQATTMTYIPGKGTVVKDEKGKEYVAPGKDFADALFRIWLGKDPISGGLKDGMLGKK